MSALVGQVNRTWIAAPATKYPVRRRTLAKSVDCFRSSGKGPNVRGIPVNLGKGWETGSLEISAGNIDGVPYPVRFDIELPRKADKRSALLSIYWEIRQYDAAPAKSTVAVLHQAIDRFLAESFADYLGSESEEASCVNEGKFNLGEESDAIIARSVEDIACRLALVQFPTASMLIQKIRAGIEQAAQAIDTLGHNIRSGLNRVQRIAPHIPGMLLRIERVRNILAEFEAGTLDLQGKDAQVFFSDLLTNWKAFPVSPREAEALADQLKREWFGE